MARKTQLISFTTFKLVLNLAMAKYNLGYGLGLRRCLEAVTGELLLAYPCFLHGLDADRVEESARRTSEICKKGGII